MRRTIALVISLALTFACASAEARKAAAKKPAAPPPSSPKFPAYVMGKIDDMYRGEGSKGVMAMKVKTRHWTRSVELESWSRGKHYSLVRILKPRKERGTATLKARNNLFIYLNKTGRTIKISSGMMGGSWMGSHFTNDDLVRHSRLSRDYNIKLAGRGSRGAVKTYRFTLQAKPNAAVVWDKLKVVVRQADLQPLEQAYYDEGGKLVRKLEFSDHRQTGGRTIPYKMLMKPLNKPGEYTEMRVKQISFSVSLKKKFFSLQRLKSR